MQGVQAFIYDLPLKPLKPSPLRCPAGQGCIGDYRPSKVVWAQKVYLVHMTRACSVGMQRGHGRTWYWWWLVDQNKASQFFDSLLCALLSVPFYLPILSNNLDQQHAK